MPFQHARSTLRQLFVCIGALIMLPPLGQAATITSLTANTVTVGRYDKYELTFNLTGVSPADYNPFRPDVTPGTYTKMDGSTWSTPAGVDVWATVITPSGRSLKLWGFWDVDFQYLGQVTNPVESQFDRIVPTSGPHWHVRYAPTETGVHTIQVFAKDQSGTTSSSKLSFTCMSSALRGWGRVAADEERFTYDNGDPFVPFGVEMSRTTTLTEDMEANGMNFIRYWAVNLDIRDIHRGISPPNWTGIQSHDYSVYRSGKRSIKRTVAGTGMVAEQRFVACRGGTYYKAYCYFKTSSDFNGTVRLLAQESKASGSKVNHYGSSIGAGANWVKSEVIFKTADTGEYIDVKPEISSGSTGTVWVDDAGVYQCDASGNVTVNWNGVFNPSMEEWNPSQMTLLPLFRLEHLLRDCEARGIQVQLCIFDYRLWGGSSTYHGFYEKFFGKDTFFTDPASISQEERVLRYLIARYSHYRSLFSWEFGNEMNASYSDTIGNWLAARADFVRSNDPYGHPITNSYWTSPASIRYAQLPSMDTNQVHYYMNTEERTSGQGVPSWWNMASGMVVDTDPANAHSGTKSCNITANGSTIGRSADVWVKPGRSYTLKYWVKTQNVSGKANCILRCFDENGKELSGSTTISNTGTVSYTQRSYSFTAPSTCARVTVELQLTGSTGYAWFDDVAVAENGTSKSLLYNGGFECAKFGDDEFEWGIYNHIRSTRMYEAGPNGTRKPYVSGEAGLMGANADLSYWAEPTSSFPRHDDTGIHVHNGIWATLMATSAVQTPTYWWTHYLFAQTPSLLSCWKGATEFAKRLPFYTIGTPVSTDAEFGDVVASSTNSAIRALGQKSGDKAYMWIQNRQNTWSRVIREGISPTPASSTVSTPRFANGTYTVEWFDTYAGKTLRTETKAVSSGTLTLSVSSLTTDVAVIVKRATAPNVALRMAADKSSAVPSEVITYTITFTNQGDELAINVDIRLPVPANTTYITGSASNGGTYDPASNSVHWVVPSLSPGTSGQYTASVRVN